jgi:hypothetical protein
MRLVLAAASALGTVAIAAIIPPLSGAIIAVAALGTILRAAFAFRAPILIEAAFPTVLAHFALAGLAHAFPALAASVTAAFFATALAAPDIAFPIAGPLILAVRLRLIVTALMLLSGHLGVRRRHDDHKGDQRSGMYKIFRHALLLVRIWLMKRLPRSHRSNFFTLIERPASFRPATQGARAPS